MDNPRLSICLPVYNQADELNRLLKSIIPQMTPEIEIIIRDDSTNSETKNIVKKFSKSFPIRYFQGIKEGIDRAVIFLVEKARGEFVWWIGDDDVVLGGISRVIEIIKNKPEVNFIWANYRIFDSKEIAIDFPSDRFFKNRDELIEEAVVGLGFISATIFRRSIALKGIEGARHCIGTEFSNLYIVLYVLAQPGENYYLRGPIIICHPASVDEIKEKTVKNGEIKNRAFEVFGVNFTRIVREFQGPFSPTVVRRTIKKSFAQVWRGILVAWVGGWDTPKNKRWRMFKLYWSFPEFWLAIPFFLLPLSVNKILFRIYKVFFSNRKLKILARKEMPQ